MRIIFCDDNAVILRQLTGYVTEFFSELGGIEPEFAAYPSGDALLAAETEAADIAFLDVEMPGSSGIQVGAALKERNPAIKIFIVTSYPDYLDDAMRFQVFRYLSKPIDRDRLFRNLKDAIYQYSIESRRFTIATSDGVFTRRAEEIVCVEAVQRKVLVHTADNIYTSTETMDYWRQTLTLPCFYSTHRSFIINMRFVYTVDREGVTLRYGGKRKDAYLSRRKFAHFKDTYLMYMESVK